MRRRPPGRRARGALTNGTSKRRASASATGRSLGRRWRCWCESRCVTRNPASLTATSCASHSRSTSAMRTRPAATRAATTGQEPREPAPGCEARHGRQRARAASRPRRRRGGLRLRSRPPRGALRPPRRRRGRTREGSSPRGARRPEAKRCGERAAPRGRRRRRSGRGGSPGETPALGPERRREAREVAEDPEDRPGRRERGDAARSREVVEADLLDEGAPVAEPHEELGVDEGAFALERRARRGGDLRISLQEKLTSRIGKEKARWIRPL